MKALVFQLIFLLALAGCVREEAAQSHLSAQLAAEKTENALTKSMPAIHDRQIHANDIVILHVIPGQEFEKELELTVNLDGEILVPLAGWIKIEGMTTGEAEEKIRKILNKDYLVNPTVSIRVKETSSRAVVILGQVRKPGTYEFPPSGKMSLLEVVAKAEGFTDIANLSKLKIVRTIPDGSQTTIRTDAGRILNGQEPDIDLQEGDLITVPETMF